MQSGRSRYPTGCGIQLWCMAIISSFDRLSRMLLTWVLGIKTAFFPDMKKQSVMVRKLISIRDILMYNGNEWRVI